jgi:glycine cleavage system regulatory protein
MATFVLTVIGDDRPGLVSALSAPISAHGGSWERSQLSRLAGKFAGIVQVSVPDDRRDALVAALDDLPGLTVTLADTSAPDPGPGVPLVLELLGDDRPGIVAEISAALADHDVSIAELSTDVREAPMTGGYLFEVRATLTAPPDLGRDLLRAALESIADELMVEVTLSEEWEAPTG